jgi:hypothetical protein
MLADRTNEFGGHMRPVGHVFETPDLRYMKLLRTGLLML